MPAEEGTIHFLPNNSEGVYGHKLGSGELVEEHDLRGDPSGRWIECEQITWGYPWDSLWVDQVVIRRGRP